MAAITLTIPDNKWDTFVRYFLMIHPNQTLDSDKPLKDDEWIRYRVLLFARGAYQKGIRQEHEAHNRPVFDVNIITLQEIVT